MIKRNSVDFKISPKWQNKLHLSIYVELKKKELLQKLPDDFHTWRTSLTKTMQLKQSAKILQGIQVKNYVIIT